MSTCCSCNTAKSQAKKLAIYFAIVGQLINDIIVESIVGIAVAYTHYTSINEGAGTSHAELRTGK